MNLKKLNKDNKGFTLIEMIVVVLILGILSSAAFISIGYVHKMNASACAAKINTILEQTRIKTMSKEDGSIALVFYRKDNDIYASVVNDSDGARVYESEILLCSGNVSIDFIYSDGTKQTIDNLSDTEVEIAFIKGSGAFRTDVSEITVKGISDVSVMLVKETGRSYVVKQG